MSRKSICVTVITELGVEYSRMILTISIFAQAGREPPSLVRLEGLGSTSPEEIIGGGLGLGCDETPNDGHVILFSG